MEYKFGIRTLKDCGCPVFYLVIAFFILITVSVAEESNRANLNSRFGGRNANGLIQATSPGNVSNYTRESRGTLSNVLLSMAKIFESVQTAAGQYIDNREKAQQKRRGERRRTSQTRESTNARPRRRSTTPSSLSPPLVKLAEQTTESTSQKTKLGPLATNSGAPVKTTRSTEANATTNQALPPLPQYAVDKEDEFVLLELQQIQNSSTATTKSTSTTVKPVASTATSPSLITTTVKPSTVRIRQTEGLPPQIPGGIIGNLARNILGGGQSASSLFSEGKSVSFGSTAKPQAAGYQEISPNEEPDEKENFGDLAPIHVLTEENEDDLEPVSRPSTAVKTKEENPALVISTAKSTVTEISTHATTVRPSTTVRPQLRGTSNRPRIVAVTTPARSPVPRPTIAIPTTVPTTAPRPSIVTSTPVSVQRVVQTKPPNSHQASISTVSLPSEFQDIKQLLAFLTSSVKESPGNGGNGHVFHINIGTINWNHGQGSHVIYNGRQVEDHLPTTSLNGQDSSQATQIISEEVPKQQGGTADVAPVVPTSNPLNNIPSSTTSATTSSTATTPIPDIDPRQPTVSSNPINTGGFIFTDPGRNGPPLPLPPIDCIDEDDFDNPSNSAEDPSKDLAAQRGTKSEDNIPSVDVRSVKPEVQNAEDRFLTPKKITLKT